jgi:2-succinyl-5-enolpyruvyl-6-hydroxy-3-cyclohexene-1-carboxylate synthase
VSSAPNESAHAFIGAFVDELARAGVRHVCVAPGSRSTPLALLLAEDPRIRLWMHLDERCAAFFALGIARATRMPAAVLCTSGTAAANFFPAVVEAQSAGVPLLVLTADRPPELREVGAAQTIDQNRLYGAHAKWFVEVALPEATPVMLRYARSLAGRAVATALSLPRGPVHLNFPLREPLVPSPGKPPANMRDGEALAWSGRPADAPWVFVEQPALLPPEREVRETAELLSHAKRPLLICGPQPDDALAPALAALAAVTQAPLLADPISQLRWGGHDRAAVIEAYDAFLPHSGHASSMAPDLVVRFGGTPTSKALLEYLAWHSAATHVVVDRERWPDPAQLASRVVRADERLLAQQLVTALRGAAGQPDPQWRDRWRETDRRARAALDAYCASLDEPFEGRALAEVAALLPAGGTIFVSSSMPVRDLDTFGRGHAGRVRVMANRGANGIDGVVSTALGVAAVRGADPLVLVIGDVALYHDMNGLLAAKQYELDATVILLNNDGGGIFSFLPQAAHPKHFETLFGTPHGLDFAHAAHMYDAKHCRAATWEAFRRAVKAGIEGRGLHLVEMQTERARNVELHRDARKAVARALPETASA